MRIIAFLIASLLPLGFLSAEEIKGAPCQVYFSPKDHLADKLIALIAKEEKSIQAAVYCFTHRGISKALGEARKRGVNVEIIVDRFSVKAKSPLAKLEQEGIAVWVWEGEETGVKRRPLMHDKFCVFSDKVWTGSFNFTRDADLSNQENALVLVDPAVVEQYRKQFIALKKVGSVPYQEFAKKHSRYKPKSLS